MQLKYHRSLHNCMIYIIIYFIPTFDLQNLFSNGTLADDRLSTESKHYGRCQRVLEVTGVRGFHLTSRLKYDIAEKLTLGVYDTYRWLVSNKK